MTGHADFLAERDAMKAEAVKATEAWHDRLVELRDALAGVQPADTDDQLLRWLARFPTAAEQELDLIRRIKLGAYPDLDNDRAELRAKRERERERDRVPPSIDRTDPTEEV